MNGVKLSRRTFVRHTSLMAAGTVAGAWPAGGATHGKAAQPTGPSTIRNYHPNMGYRRLGKTGLTISEVSMGGHNNRMEKRYQYYPRTKIVPEDVDDSEQYADYYKERTEQIACALDAGINFFDPTNDCEVRSLSVALNRLGRRDDCHICGDFIRGRYRDEKTPADLRDSLVAHINKTIRVLETDRVDLVRISTFEQWSLEELAAGIEGFERLKEEGKAGLFGISSHDPTYIIKAVNRLPEIDFIVTPYSFAHRLAEKELFPLCREQGIGVITIKPFHGGAFFLDEENSREDRRDYVSTPPPETLKKITAGEGRSLAQANLRYILANPHVTATIPGMNSRPEILENARASRGNNTGSLDRRQLQRRAEAVRRGLPPAYQWLNKWRA